MFLRKKIDQYRENSLFLRGVAHELRNRSHAFIQLPDYLLKTESRAWNIPLIQEQSELQKESIEYLTKSLNKAIETRSLYKLKLEDIKIGETFNEVKNILFMDLTKGLITLKDVAKNGVDDETIRTENDIFVSIFINLLLNSIKAYRKFDTQKEHQIIMERSIIDRTKLFIVIEDMAGGIDQTIASKMSDPSKHIVGDTTGLNVVKRYIATLGGTVSYKTIEGEKRKGTRVEITLPMSPPE
jgi:signal transduction histidine kinase